MVDRIDFSNVPKDRGAGYDSSFESDAEKEKKRQSLKDLLPGKRKREKLPNKHVVEEELDREEARIYRTKEVAKDAYSRHKEYINNYLLYYGGKAQEFHRDSSNDRTDMDVIRENHKFLWEDTDTESNTSWEIRLAKKYYDKLFKEYCIADLSLYKQNKIGMRWRIQKEVVSGKGQFVCGNKKCDDAEGLRSWEVNFGYVEQGDKKNALVKLRLCPDCSYKLNYHHKRKEVKRQKKESKHQQKEKTHSASKKHKKHKKHKKRRHGDQGETSQSGNSIDSDHERDGDDDGETEQDEDIWKKPVALTEEKSREDEFDEYFEDMFL